MNQEKSSIDIETLPVIDWELCVKLANNKTEIAGEILIFVLQQLPGDLLDIKQAYHKTDYSELLRGIHKLHGALCYTGMPQLKNIVAELETLLKMKELDKKLVQEMMKQLDAAAQQVLESKVRPL